MKAPDKIFAWPSASNGMTIKGGLASEAVEYTRTDLSQASVAAALEAAAVKASLTFEREYASRDEMRAQDIIVDRIRALITTDQRTALAAHVAAEVAKARAEDARARGYSSAADVSDIVEAFRIAGPIALADFKSHPFILNDKEEAAVALITAALAKIGAKP